MDTSFQSRSIIEHFSLETNPRTNTLAENSPGIYAMEFLPKYTVSEAFSIQDLMNAPVLDKRSRILCGLKANYANVLNVNPDLLRFMKFSKDIQSYNAIFELLNDGVRLRITHDIHKDTEIVVWFTEELSLIMAIPFLTPLNIRGIHIM